MTYRIILFLLLFSAGLSFGQSPAEANSLFESGLYPEALTAYEHLLKRKPKDALYNYRAGLSAFQTGDLDKAVLHFQHASNKYPLGNYYLGNIHFDSYKFQDAVDAYENFLKSVSPEDSLFAKVEKRLSQSMLGANFINRVEDVEIVDSMVVDKKNLLTRLTLAPDLGRLKQTRLNLGEKGEIDNIQYTTQRGDRMYLSEYLNNNSDLYTSIKLLDKWADNQPIDDLNTAGNENYPFLLPDGITLYFASDGENSMGGYDLFITRLNTTDNTFLKPENLGMPFNSPFNDYMLVLDELRNVGWFASDRYQPDGKVALYQFIPNKEKKIIRTEDQDSLINRAKITYFSGSKLQLETPRESQKKQAVARTGQIFIKNDLTYSNANDFNSNEARNHFFQMQKLKEEKQSIENELITLRNKYRNSAGQSKQEIGQRIITLENRLRILPELINSHTRQMRNKEIVEVRKP